MNQTRNTGAGVSLTSDWGDSFGLTCLPEDSRQQV